MPRKTSLVVGSTGFVGSKIVKSLSEVEGETIALTRRSINDLPKNTKELLIKFDEDLSNLILPECDHIYLSLGHDLYYWNVMGFMEEDLKESFYEVDYVYQTSIARKAKESGANVISFISAVGANANSSNYYLKIKGEVEEEIKEIGFKSVNFFQPGHIMGNKFRADILFADAVSIFFNPFLIGDFRKFRSISIRDLPQFIVNKTNEEKEGINYYDYNSIVRRNNY